ncbi:MAG: hypothetical protein AAF601_00190 [Pseudomonadota bacterium]
MRRLLKGVGAVHSRQMLPRKTSRPPIPRPAQPVNSHKADGCHPIKNADLRGPPHARTSIGLIAGRGAKTWVYHLGPSNIIADKAPPARRLHDNCARQTPKDTADIATLLQ